LDFDEFYGTSYRKVYAAAFAFAGNSEVAADAAQEAFVRAFARWSRLRNEQWIEGWVMTTAMNLCRRSLRRRLRIASSAESVGAQPPSLDAVEVVEALRQLSPRQRMAIVLHYLTDMPVTEVARSMEVSEGTVKAHLAQARRRLRPLLEVTDGG